MKQRQIGIFLIAGLLFLAAAPAMAQDEPVPSTYEKITMTDNHDADPAVSPDGKTLAFSSDRNGNYDLFIRVLAEPGETQITSQPKHDQNPSWYGDKLVYESNRTGNWDLFQISTKEKQGELQWSSAKPDETFASVNPKTKKLLFTRKGKKGFGISFGAKDLDICVAEDNPNQATVIAQGFTPRSSPDGKTVVFSSRRTKNHDVWVCPIEGGPTTQLTTDSAEDLEPCFSPDGERIVFASNRAGNYDIWIMNTDGGKKVQLTTYSKDERQPFWAIDGKIYFVVTEKVGTSNIYALKAPVD